MCTPPLALFGRGPAHTPGAAHEGTCRGRTGASSRALQGRPGRSNSTHPVEQRDSGSLQLVCWGMHAWDRGTGGVCALTLRSARNTSLVAVQLPSMPPSGRACPEARALQQLTCPASALWRGLVVHSAAGMVDATNRRAGKRRRLGRRSRGGQSAWCICAWRWANPQEPSLWLFSTAAPNSGGCRPCSKLR